MQIRCSNCHKPFAIGKDEIHIALSMITAEGLAHYNAHCPHCRRANRISPEELQRAAPDWQPATDQEKQQANPD
jgi:phage FluMu protein Com